MIVCLALPGPTSSHDSSVHPSGHIGTHTRSVSVSCNESLNQPVGFIVSSFYPAHYPNNSNCVWRMSLETSHQIILTFNSFSVDYSDVLLLYNSSTENGTLILTRTGQCAVSKTSDCPQHDFHSFIAKGFSLHFVSDFFGTDKGFNISYEIQQIGQ